MEEKKQFPGLARHPEPLGRGGNITKKEGKGGV